MARATVFSCTMSTASGGDVSSTPVPSLCVPAKSCTISRALTTVLARRHAEADQQGADDDIGEIER
jgi:hypothetical protein